MISTEWTHKQRTSQNLQTAQTSEFFVRINSLLTESDRHDVYTTSHQRRCNVASTLIRRCLNVACPLGRLARLSRCTDWPGTSVFTHARFLIFAVSYTKVTLKISGTLVLYRTYPKISTSPCIWLLYENRPIQIYCKFHHKKNKKKQKKTTTTTKFSDKNSDIFRISAQNIDYDYSLEPLRRGGSNEYPQSQDVFEQK